MNHARHLWDIQWFRDLVLILVALIVLLLAYSLRGILLPIVMALALAYAFHPLISWLQAKAHIPRWLSTTGLLAITSAAVLSLFLWLTPQLLSQTRSLYARLPGYTKYATQEFQAFQKWVAESGAEDEPATTQPASQPSTQPTTQSASQPSTQPATQPTSQPSIESISQAAASAREDGKITVGEALPVINTTVEKLVHATIDEQAATQPATQPANQSAAQPATSPTTQPALSSATSEPVEHADDEPQTSHNSFWQWGEKLLGVDDAQDTHANNQSRDSASTQPATTQPGTSKNSWSKTLTEMDVTTVGSMLVQTFNYGLGVVGVTLSLGMYLLLVMALLVLGFFFFSWKFDSIIHWFDSFIPNSKRPRILHILGRMDKAISAFVRGRLVQVSIITCVLCVGWAWVGVPYWLLLGVLGGMLNIVPYAAVVAWPIAILLMWIDTASGSSGATFTFTQVFIWPSVVYIVAQSLDGWVVEPLVQGKATNLDPFSVLVAVIIGGSLLGVLGTIIAVPTAACLKIFLEEVVLPHIRSEIHRRDNASVAHDKEVAARHAKTPKVIAPKPD